MFHLASDWLFWQHSDIPEINVILTNKSKTKCSLLLDSHHNKGLEMCGCTKYPYSPHGNSLEFLRGGGGAGLKAKLLEGKYEAKLEFPGGGGGANEKPSVGSMDILRTHSITFLA